MSVVRCQVEVSATARSLVQRSPTDCGVSSCVIYKPQECGGPRPHWAVAPEGESINDLAFVVEENVFCGLETSEGRGFDSRWSHWNFSVT